MDNFSWNPLALESIDGGKFIVKANHNLEQVIQDCLDFGLTTKRRCLTIKIWAEPDEDRKKVDVEYEISKKLASEPPGSDQVFIGRKGAVFAASEQLSFDENVEEMRKEAKND
jgi:hypothetical protein